MRTSVRPRPPRGARAARLTVVAGGLDNPRGIGFGPDGALYVAESGSGGSGPCVPSPEGGEACFGRTGAVTRITKRSQHRVLTGLPSVAEAGGVATGPGGSLRPGPSRQYSTEMCTWSSWRRVGLQLQGSEGCR